MSKPNGIDPVEWARYNERMQRTLTMLSRMDHSEVPLERYAVEVVELPPAIQDLTLAVRRAAGELEGQGERSDRIATQLLTALARFASETGT